jgi:hypothetical protein
MARAIVLEGHLLIPSFGIAKFAVNVCSPDTNKNTNKTDGCGECTEFWSAGVLINVLKFRFAAANFYVCFQCVATFLKTGGIELRL